MKPGVPEAESVPQYLDRVEKLRFALATMKALLAYMEREEPDEKVE